MSNSAGHTGRAGAGTGKPVAGPLKLASAIAERDKPDHLLGFLSRLAAFGLAAGRDPLLKPAKPGN